MLTTLLVLASAALAAGLTWLVAQARAAATAERARLAEDRLADAEKKLHEGEQLRAQAQADLAAAKAEAGAQLAAEQRRSADQVQRAAQYLADIEKMRSTLQDQFQAVASQLLDEKSARFSGENKTQVEALLQPLRQQLTDFRSRIDTVYKAENDDRVSLKAQIEQLRQLNARITDEAHALTQALKGQAQTRGAWGELVLERLLESSGLRRGEDYIAQESIVGADGRSRVRPDIIIRLPEQRHLVIDSKVSLVDYEQAVNASEPAVRDAARKAHVAAVRKRVQELADKSYEDAGQLFTPEYVFMFIPIEPAFALALETDPAIYEWAFERKVILVTSSGLLVALRTVATIWKQDRQTKNVQEIARRGGLLYDKFVGLYGDLEDLGRHLGKARESYDEVLGKLKTGRGNLLTQVEELKTLGAKAQKSLPPGDGAND